MGSLDAFQRWSSGLLLLGGNAHSLKNSWPHVSICTTCWFAQAQLDLLSRLDCYHQITLWLDNHVAYRGLRFVALPCSTWTCSSSRRFCNRFNGWLPSHQVCRNRHTACLWWWLMVSWISLSTLWLELQCHRGDMWQFLCPRLIPPRKVLPVPLAAHYDHQRHWIQAMCALVGFG